MKRTRIVGAVAAAGVLWLGVVAVGLAALMDYDNRPGNPAHAPLQWPAGSRLSRTNEAPTLVMLAHPRCDCTRASLGELAELLAQAQRKPRVLVVFIKPGRVGPAWEQSELWRIASGIPGVTVVRDDEGIEARRFGVETSGQTLLYDVGGRLLFSGGATGSRGKPGNNVGRATLLALLNGEPPPTNSTPVFGCPLFGPADAPEPEGAHAHGD
ncbi:MAG TPA: hypothetical protein VN700_07560 [Vicinamibacterales bacterium]|nr:hypothetical protein [Vicinamibacterales bacterium]